MFSLSLRLMLSHKVLKYFVLCHGIRTHGSFSFLWWLIDNCTTMFCESFAKWSRQRAELSEAQMFIEFSVLYGGVLREFCVAPWS
jgi:hypothetical protein